MRRLFLAYTFLAYAFILVVLGGACVEESMIKESPLATWAPGNSGFYLLASSGEGTLDIAHGCVRLIQGTEVDEKSTLLVWPEPTSWNTSTQLIDFVDVLGNRLELRDGDKIEAGGVGYPPAESPEYMGKPTFVSPPDPSCTADEFFVLNSISVIRTE